MTYSEKTLKDVRFGDYTFDQANGFLKKGEEQIHLRPLAIRLLTILLSNSGSLVSRDELRRELWGERVVEWETGLHRLVKELRTALQEDARHPRYIRTVARRGYRFCISAESTVHATRKDLEAIHRTKWFIAGTLVVPISVLAMCVYLGLAGA
jgi:DNA-binding winged helix-turn-helix (wHTH) protein